MTEHFAYDVFISYSHRDEDWVTRTLLPRLEAAGLRVCVDFRDFEIGAPSVTEMERAVVTSRKTLLVLTPNYLASAWTEFESVMLQTLDPANRQRRLIGLLKARSELPLRISYLSYVDFVEPNDPAFTWNRLLTALSTSSGSPLPSTPAGPASSTPDLRDLRKRLIERCTTNDLKDLCFALGLDYDRYVGEHKDVVRDLLTDVNKAGRLDQFVQVVREEMPHVLS